MRSWFLALCLSCSLLPTRLHAQPTLGRGARVQALIARGDAYRSRGDNVSSLAFYRDAIAAAPRDARGYQALGAAYLELREPERALEVYEAGTQATGGDAHLLLGLAHTHLALHHDERALEVLRGLVRGLPQSREALEALAEAAERSGKWTEALAARRALLRAARDSSALAAADAAVRALETILGRADRVRVAHCGRGASEIARALAKCP